MSSPADDWEDIPLPKAKTQDEWEDIPPQRSEVEPLTAPAPKQEKPGFLGLEPLDLARMADPTGALAAKDAWDVIRGDPAKTQKLRSFLQGITLNQAGKRLSGVGPLDALRAFGPTSTLVAAKDAWDAFGSTPKAPSETESLYAKASEDYPVHGMAGALAAPLPGPGKLKALSGWKGTAARLGASGGAGAAVGALAASGENRSALKGAMYGGVAGLVGGGLGEAGRKLAERGLAKQAAALARQRELSQAAADKALASGIGKLGGETSNASNVLRVLEDATTNPAVSAESKAAAKEILEGPMGAALREKVVRNTLERAPQTLSRVESAKQALDPLRQATASDAVEQATAKALANPVRDSIWPRVRKQLVDRALVPAVGAGVGALLGGEEHRGAGAAAGAVASSVAGGLVGGRASSAFERMLRQPDVQRLFGRALERAGSGASRLGRTAPVVGGYLAGSSALSGLSPDEKRLLLEWAAKQEAAP